MTEAAVQFLSAADARLAALVQRVGPCTLRPRKTRTPFEALAQSIVYQQLHGLAATAIFTRFKALYPARRFPRPEDVLATGDELLRGAGLSRSKAAALKDLAAKTLSGVVPSRRNIEKLSDAEIVERLSVVRGIGPWTAEMLLIFTMGRPDVLPATDYGVRKGFALAYGWKELPTPKELSREGEKWRPYRTTAAWYFWRSLDTVTMS